MLLPPAMLLRHLLPILLCACFGTSNAQQDAPLRFERIEGLSQSTAYSIMKDKQGFLWIATGNGLNRYDGVEMKIYKPALEKKKGQMQGRIIRSELLKDEQEKMWFSTDLTIHCFDKKKEAFQTHDVSDKSTHQSFDRETDGGRVFANPLLLKNTHLWLANSDLGLFDLNTETKEYVHNPLVFKDELDDYIRIMYNGVHDGKGDLWFASNKGLFSLILPTLLIVPSISSTSCAPSSRATPPQRMIMGMLWVPCRETRSQVRLKIRTITQ
jgi:ligand-binding sensor domain-containing protein